MIYLLYKADFVLKQIKGSIYKIKEIQEKKWVNL